LKTIVLGPPGTGKTTTLLNLLEDYLKKTDPNRIGYFAFTQKAANEARDRAMERFNLSEDDLPYFRTLHSLAFRMLGIRKENVMQRRHYEDLGKKIKIFVDYNDYDEEFSGLFTTKSDYLRIIHLARLRGITPEQQFNSREHTQDVSVKNLRILANELDRYKKDYGLIDFTDMISHFTRSDKSPRFDVVFIDEAQDLSFMQWDMAKSIWNKTEDSFIAGDDDQALFRWAGADVNRFITQKGKLLNLTQSYRIPKAVHDVAINIIGRVSNRLKKEWQPRTVEGQLSYHNEFRDIDFSSGKWLVLARTKYMLNELENTLYKKGLYYKNKFKKGYEQDLHEAIMDWEKLRTGKEMTGDRIQRIASYMGENNFSKFRIKEMDKDNYYSTASLKLHFGLKTDDVWFNAFDEAPQINVYYIINMRENCEKLNQEPRILLSTIHGVKGGEADNVVLLSDLSLNTQKGYEKNPDDENRLFYVGATRTKEHLHVVKPKDIYKSFKI
jgi:DNA helicase-2/ATP-dependent DNA helicase PcrA